jgi:PilZ domain
MEAGYEIFCNGNPLASTRRDISPIGISIFKKEKIDPKTSININLVLSERQITLDIKGSVRHCTDNQTGADQAGEVGNNRFPPNSPFYSGILVQ